jgi:hypothetical protein
MVGPCEVQIPSANVAITAAGAPLSLPLELDYARTAASLYQLILAS